MGNSRADERGSMSSKLKKKNKNKFFNRNELANMNDYAKRVSNTDKLIEESYYNIRLIAYQILHDKFSFGQKRIIRLEQTIDKYMEEKEQLNTDELLFYMKEKCKIDVKEEINKVPFRERFALTKYKINVDSQQSAGMYILASLCSYFSLLGVCLKTQFKFSTRQIKEVYEWIRYYINTLSRQKQFDLTIKDIAECLIEEVGYCDFRFAGSGGKEWTQKNT